MKEWWRIVDIVMKELAFDIVGQKKIKCVTWRLLIVDWKGIFSSSAYEAIGSSPAPKQQHWNIKIKINLKYFFSKEILRKTNNSIGLECNSLVGKMHNAIDIQNGEIRGLHDYNINNLWWKIASHLLDDGIHKFHLISRPLTLRLKSWVIKWKCPHQTRLKNDKTS